MAIDQSSRSGIVGAGNMGAMMALGLAEKGLNIRIWDVQTRNIDAAQEMPRQTLTLQSKVDGFDNVKDFTNSLSVERTKLFAFSITHGSPADAVLEKIWDELSEGDIIPDGGPGIKHGMLSLICEAWCLLQKSLGLSNAEIGKVFAAWNASGELRDRFLLETGAEIFASGRRHPRATRTARERVTLETALRHVAAPTIVTGHARRIASGNQAQRVKVADKLKPPGVRKADTEMLRKKDTFIEDLRRAVYAGFLASFAQGLELIARASRDEGWDVSIADCLQIWRAGCIIRAGHIADLLQPVIVSSTAPIFNIKLIDEVARDIRETYAPLKTVVTKGVQWDAVIPALSASLEYVKYLGNTELPTQFQEAQMEFFGAHGYDRVGVNGEDPGKTRKGAHHYEWRPA